MEYYYALRKEIGKLRDQHTFFYPPCLNSFLAVLPYFFIFKNIDNQILVYARKNTNFHVIQYYLGKMKVVDIDGKLILKIKFNDLEEMEGQSPAEGLARWSEINFPYLKNPLGRLHCVVMNMFSNRNLSCFNIPKGNLIVIYKDDAGKIGEVSLPFLLISLKKYDSIEEICPLLEQYYRTSDENISYQRKKAYHHSLGKVLDDRRIFGKKMKNKILKQIYKDNNVRLFNNSSKNMENDTFINISRNTNAIIIPEKKLAILNIYSFRVENTTDIFLFCKSILKTFNSSRAYNIKYLIVTLFNNGGGNICMNYFFQNILFQKRLLSFPEDIPVTRLNYFWFNSGHGISSINCYSLDGKRKINPFKEGIKDEEFGKYNISIPPHRKRKFTTKFLVSCDKLTNIISTTYPELFYSALSFRFNSNNILFFTNGLCASACAELVSKVKEMKYGRVITFGIVPGENGKKKVYISEGAAGKILTLSSTLRYIEKVGLNLPFPGKFYRKGGDITISVNKYYSTIKGEEDQIMDYKLYRPDEMEDIFIENNKIHDLEYIKNISLKQYYKYFSKTNGKSGRKDDE